MAKGHRATPTGTVSFLFTDITGSTPLWERHPDAMRQALERHDAILRAAIEEHSGLVFSTAGDGFSAAFWTPGDAAGAALDAQRALQAELWPADAPVKVRMGVHLGTVQERDGDYFGSAVNRAARIMGLAQGGQVVVSLAVEELVRDELPDGVGLKNLGDHALKGLSRPETVFQLTAPEMPADFPPLAAAVSVPGNLPSPPTSFVGRVEETKRLAAEIPTHRLVTLVGPGGVGKTRLSIEVAATVSDEFGDGVWLVELAPVAGADAVVHAVASALSVSPEAGSSLLESIVGSLAGRRVLVVLDNCEHVIDAAADIAAAVGRGAPTSTVMTTSREPLGVAGERIWMVSALDSEVEAAELFCERAAAADQRFDPSDDDLELIGRVCERLDGMPLAIELAASRIRSMSLPQLADRLADRFRVLRSSARGGAVERHQTLRATVEWSYRLLTPDEQVLFDRLSVFAGDFEVEAAEVVCGFDPLDEMDVFDLLGSLVDKSLVVLDRDTGRYRLLETLRQYGAERLVDGGEAESLRDRHLVRCVEVAELARRDFEGTACVAGAERFVVEWDGLRAGLLWAIERGAGEQGGRLVEAAAMFGMFWWRNELADWAERLIALGSPRPEVFGVAAYFSSTVGLADRSLDLSARGIAAASGPDDAATATCWLARASTLASVNGRARDALDAVEHLVVAAEACPPWDVFGRAHAHQWAAVIHAIAATGAGEYHLECARRISAPLDNPVLDGHQAHAAGNIASGAGDKAGAIAHFEEMAMLGELTASPFLSGIAPMMKALNAFALTDHQAAIGEYRSAISKLREAGHWINLWPTIESLAGWWATFGHLEPAAVVIGHLDAHGLATNFLARRRSATTELVDGHPNADRRRAEGAAMTRDEVVAYCRERLDAG